MAIELRIPRFLQILQPSEDDDGVDLEYRSHWDFAKYTNLVILLK